MKDAKLLTPASTGWAMLFNQIDIQIMSPDEQKSCFQLLLTYNSKVGGDESRVECRIQDRLDGLYRRDMTLQNLKWNNNLYHFWKEHAAITYACIFKRTSLLKCDISSLIQIIIVNRRTFQPQCILDRKALNARTIPLQKKINQQGLFLTVCFYQHLKGISFNILSSTEHKVFRVSCCDWSSCVMCRPSICSL